MVISVELDNGCHAVLDEGKTEKVRDDFSADATSMDFNVMDVCDVIYPDGYGKNSALIRQDFQ